MKRTSPLIRILNNLLLIGILIFASVEVVLLVSPNKTLQPVAAQDPPVANKPAEGAPASAIPAPDDISKCSAFLQTKMKKEMEIFGKFMNDNFQSKKPTSELTAAAIERFRIYRQVIRDELALQDPAVAKAAPSAALSQISSCARAVEENFTLMKVMIRSHISENASAKQSTRLLDKYQEIGKKLDKLNFTIGQMAGYFGTLAQKLPCYATECIKG